MSIEPFPFTYVCAPEALPETIDFAVFLAGPTPRSTEVASWRPGALSQLAAAGFTGVVLDPERSSAHYDYDDQVAWESTALEMADIILFWVPRELEHMPAFTTNVEFGVWLRSGKVIVGGPRGAAKNKYLTYTAERTGLVWHDNLGDIITRTVGVASRFSATRTGPDRMVPATVWATESFQSWRADLVTSGHGLVDITVPFAFPARVDRSPFLWVAHPKVNVAGEGRYKGNEIIVGRPDISAVVAHGPVGADLGKVEVVIVSEYRSPGRSPEGIVPELPAGSAPNGGDPRDVGVTELFEETGLLVDSSRLHAVTVAQLAATLTTHRAHVFEVELSDDELDQVRTSGPHGVCADDEEFTYPSVRTVNELVCPVDGVGPVDLSVLGMVYLALSQAS